VREFLGGKGTGETGWILLSVLAEREGFEPPIPVKVCLISSQVHSTALPPLRVSRGNSHDNHK
jgi:hypothetical protein